MSDALRSLIDTSLVACAPEGDAPPNQYRLVGREGVRAIDAHEPATPEGTPEPRAAPCSRQDGRLPETAVACSTAGTEVIPPPPSQTSASSAPFQRTLAELIARCFRPLTPEEFAWLKSLFPDEDTLVRRLSILHGLGGVVPDLGIGFLARALDTLKDEQRIRELAYR